METTNNELVLELFSNPSLVQAKALEDMEARLTGGVPITDGNNVCSFLLENFAANSADIVKSMINEINPLYALRAQTAEDLYKHMSDFDYLNLFSTPAITYIELTFRKDTLVKGAVDYNSYYNKLVIPKNSVFTVEQFTFGIYYPIELRINKNTNTVIVVYDTTEDNPLHALSQNTIEHREHNMNGLELISMMIPVYQFKRSTKLEELSQSSSFVKHLPYEDKFYAVRVYTNNGVGGAFVEVAQTLSDEVYDPNTATVQFVVDPESKRIKLAIPQTYLTAGLFGPRLQVDILTTKGAIDANVSAITPGQITTRFTTTGDPEKDKYIKPITKPDVLITRLVTSKITGGGDGLTFEELRNRVIHNSFYGSVILSPVDVINYLADRGFSARKYRDGITDRVYICSKELRSSKSVVIPSANIPTEFNTASLLGVSSINNNADESFTVYPTTLYKYDKTTGRTVPVSDVGVAAISLMSKAELIEEFNDNIYTTCPYHVRVDTDYRFPSAYVYDFNTPIVNSLEFVAENVNVATQLSCANIVVKHEPGDIGGFEIELYVIRSADLEGVAVSNFKTIISFASATGQTVYQEAIYDREEVGMSVFKVQLDTDYDITGSQKLKVTSLSSATGPLGHYVDLRSNMQIAFFVSNSILTSAGPTTVANQLAPLFPTYIPVTEQLADVTLGRLKKEAFSNVDIMYSALEYELWDATALLQYSVDVYERDENGNIVYTIDPGTGAVVLTIAHSAGDTVYNLETVYLTAANIADYYLSIVVADGQTISEVNQGDYIDTLQELQVPVVLHREGDIKLDNYGNPIISQDREILYYVDMLQVDRKLHYSSRPEHADFYAKLIDTLNANQLVVEELKPQLIEETVAYYTPLRSLGLSEFKLDNLATTTLDLEMSVALKLYVQKHVIANKKLLKALRDNIISVVDTTIDSGVISLVAIAEQIKTEAGGLITSIDVVSVNDTDSLQTLVSSNDQVVPSLKTVLLLNDANEIITGRALNLEFVEMDV